MFRSFTLVNHWLISAIGGDMVELLRASVNGKRSHSNHRSTKWQGHNTTNYHSRPPCPIIHGLYKDIHKPSGGHFWLFRPIFRPFLTHPLGLCLNWHLFQYVPIGTIAKIWTNPGTTKAQHKDQRSQDMYPKIDDHHKGKYVNRVIAFFWIFNSGRQNPKSSGY